MFTVVVSLILLVAAPMQAVVGQALSPNTSRPEVRGRVTDAASGRPVVAAQILARGSSGMVVRATRSESDGSYVLTGLPSGRYTLEAARLGFATQTRPSITVGTDGPTVVDFALPAVALQAEAIVVTTSRRVERVVDTDATVSVVDGASVEQQRESTVFGAIKGVKGIDYFASGLGQQQVNARGFVNPFTTNLLFLIDHRLASLPGLGTVLPGLVMAAQNDVSRVEVVTGPSSALYGANAGNGVVNVITKDPLEQPGQELEFTAGERGTLRISGRSSGPAGSRLGYKLTVEHYQANDFERRNTFTGLGGYSIQDDPNFDVQNQTLSGALHVLPAPGARLVYAGGFTQADYVNLTVVSRLQVEDYQAWYQQLRGHFETDIGTWFAQAYYTKNDAGNSYYLDILTRSQIPQANGGPGLSFDEALQRATFVDRSDRFDAEIQHRVVLGSNHVVTSGAQWRHIRPASGGTYLTDGAGGAPIRIDETGAYVGYENLIVPNVRLNVVGRFDDHSDFGFRFSPKAAVSYMPGGDHTLRLSYNRAFNSPTTYLLYAQSIVGRDASGLPVYVRGNRAGFELVNVAGGAAPNPIPALEPLDVQSFELGYRGIFADQVFADVSVYRSLYRNYISKEAPISRPQDSIFARDAATGQLFREQTRTYLNYGELPVLGADMGIQVVARQWQLSGNVSHQAPQTFRRPLAGLDPPSFNAPRWKYKFTVAYRDWWQPGSFVEVSGRRVDAFDFVSSLPYLTGLVEGYEVVDASASLGWMRLPVGQMNVSVAVKNVFDSNHVEVPGGAPLGRLAAVTFSLRR
jgi:iron complex outermembrane receptor protein